MRSTATATLANLFVTAVTVLSTCNATPAKRSRLSAEALRRGRDRFNPLGMAFVHSGLFSRRTSNNAAHGHGDVSMTICVVCR